MRETDKGKKNENGAYLSPYPVSRLAPAFELVDLAEEIAKADDLLSMQTGGKLKLLADQIRRLQEEAHTLLEKTRRDQQLHRAECNFRKKPGQIYHLYKKKDQSLIISMLSPADWGGRKPYGYEGSFRLESDMGWTEMDDEET
ncbi:MAG TPA: DUF2452 domain-containing protein [Desulfopila sp.]|nr:DUF2452 domain-containing protein [Desulfopila sp.]